MREREKIQGETASNMRLGLKLCVLNVSSWGHSAMSTLLLISPFSRKNVAFLGTPDRFLRLSRKSCNVAQVLSCDHQ
jgi:hypothetical protein